MLDAEADTDVEVEAEADTDVDTDATATSTSNANNDNQSNATNNIGPITVHTPINIYVTCGCCGKKHKCRIDGMNGDCDEEDEEDAINNILKEHKYYETNKSFAQ